VASPLPTETHAAVRWCSSCLAIYRAEFARCPIDGAILERTADDPLIGMTIAQHYVIDAFLGEGAMARVYRAHHALLAQKQFAVKIMIGDLAAILEMRLRFAQEANAASQLEHPNVVSVIDFGRSESGLMFIAMELVDGRTLADVIQNEGPLPARRVLALTRQICLGLAHAHEKGLVHRDLKPDNIVLTSRDRVRIVDFGLAIPMDDERSTRLTGVGLAMGTPIYAAPEQTNVEPVDHRADLFALGVTMFEMLAGKPPFEGNLFEIVRQNASDTMPSIASRAGKRIPSGFEEVVRKLMRRDPADRFASAMDVIAALDTAQQSPSRFVSRPMAPMRKRRWPRLVLGAALLASLAGAGHAVWIEEDGVVSRVPDAPTPSSAEAIAMKLSPEIAFVESPPPPPPEPEPAPPPRRHVRVAAKPTPAVKAPMKATMKPVVKPAPRPIAKATAKPAQPSQVSDEEFYGGPTSFSRLPDPVDAEAAKASAAETFAPKTP
jgi:serine/threonine protein kinase